MIYLNQTEFEDQETCKVYDNSHVLNSKVSSHVTIGEDSYINKSILKEHVQINRRNFILDSTLGECTYTGHNTTIRHSNIGKYCSVAWNVSIVGGGARHKYDTLTTHPFLQLSSFGVVEENTSLYHEYRRAVLGNDVWIGMHSSVLPGVTVGNGVVIGANTLVNKDIPDYAVVVGSPCRILRYRFSSDIIESLLKTRWWDWPADLLKENSALFDGRLTMEKCLKMEEIASKLFSE